ncbi:hypothetical protein [Vibrio sp. MEBiC08052]|uniref:hypothetical protein n=1 Tax=Vibrio sp. MEBiC08052 TaxID=1761910 RepID=UPI0007411368|nr:hypothetical protein [Vibrio sp. MEBiC08052]
MKEISFLTTIFLLGCSSNVDDRQDYYLRNLSSGVANIQESTKDSYVQIQKAIDNINEFKDVIHQRLNRIEDKGIEYREETVELHKLLAKANEDLLNVERMARDTNKQTILNKGEIEKINSRYQRLIFNIQASLLRMDKIEMEGQMRIDAIKNGTKKGISFE